MMTTTSSSSSYPRYSNNSNDTNNMLVFGDATRFVDPVQLPSSSSVSPSQFVHVVDPDSPCSLSPIDLDNDDDFTMTTTTPSPFLSSSDSPPITMPLKGEEEEDYDCEEEEDEESNGFIKSNTLKKRRSTTTFCTSGRITPIRENRSTTTSGGGGSTSTGTRGGGGGGIGGTGTGTGSGTVVFDKNVSVILIPTRKEYPSELRNSLWLDRKEHKLNKERNLIEFEAEGFDWRNVMDDDDMVYNPTCGNFIHPIHYGQRWFHITCQMSKQKQHFYNEIIMTLPKPTPVRPTAPVQMKKNKTKKKKTTTKSSSSEEESSEASTSTSKKNDEESKSSEKTTTTTKVVPATSTGVNNFIPHFVSSCNALPFPF